MADQDNQDSNPVLAIGLASVAILGVLSGLLPAGLVERMGHSKSTAPNPDLLARRLQMSSTRGSGAIQEREQAKPAENEGRVAFSRPPSEPAGEQAPQEFDAMPASIAGSGTVPASGPMPREDEAMFRQQQPVPVLVPGEKQARPYPQPVFPAVPAWGGYPPPVYPPIYPYYRPPYY